ncbi:MAG: hypothetical protein CL678_07995 [Bdellovibrionaceae bacterium]|nr:hypothetical protein [Pseudobdellovibrionaceae bacterium]|tara:strand:- start:774 stop:1187 length:414 start_codon:yes stop_codon:yes gene_type:complete
MKSILLPTDFSDISRNTAFQVLRLFKQSSELISLVFVSSYLLPIVDSQNAVVVNDLVKAQVLENLENEKRFFLKFSKEMKLSIEVKARFGSIENIVPELLKSEKFDLIAVGRAHSGDLLSISRSLKEKGLSSPLLIV